MDANPTPWRPRVAYPLLGLVACVAAVATYLLVPVGTGSEPVAAASARAATPTAREFADRFVGTANAYAAAHGHTTRVENVDCVQAAPGRYMCSYAERQPGAPEQCHIMQARWTPQKTSTITITLAGRTERCASLPDALQSLS
jgi:hypothetical protein